MTALSSSSRIRLQACGLLNAPAAGVELGMVVVLSTLEEVATFKRCVRRAIGFLASSSLRSRHSVDHPF
jgi:hypothetical protein